MRQAAVAVLVLMCAAFASDAIDELGLNSFGVAIFIAESTESIFMIICPESMILPDDALCVHAPGSVLEATQTINKLAVWEWRWAYWDAGLWDARRVLNADDGALWIVVRDGTTVREARPIGVVYPFDGVLIGVYERPEGE